MADHYQLNGDFTNNKRFHHICAHVVISTQMHSNAKDASMSTATHTRTHTQPHERGDRGEINIREMHTFVWFYLGTKFKGCACVCVCVCVVCVCVCLCVCDTYVVDWLVDESIKACTGRTSSSRKSHRQGEKPTHTRMHTHAVPNL